MKSQLTSMNIALYVRVMAGLQVDGFSEVLLK